MDTLFGTGQQGKSPNITAQRRINCYYEFSKDGDKTSVSIIGTPGKELFVSFGDTPVRGMHVPQDSDYCYMVHRGTFYEVNNAGVKTSRGTLNTTSGMVSMDDNGTQVQIVDGTDGWIYNTSTLAFTEITDADYPANPITACFDSGRFINSFVSSGRFYGSDAYDGTSWSGTNFATAESQPDYLHRVFSLYGQVILFGTNTIEPWSNAGLPGFPYLRVGGASAEYGLAARWSLARFMGSAAFLARVRGGQSIVGMLDGYNVRRISTAEVDHVINGYASVDDATAFSYTLGGHPMYQLNFPTAGTSWLYDGLTDLWSELKSDGLDRDRGEISVEFQNDLLISDYSTGDVYKLKSDVYTENGDTIRMELTSRHLYNEGKLIPISSFQVDGEMGVGLVSGQGVDPVMMISFSVDGGRTFGSEVMVPMGSIGEYLNRARLTRLGSARDWVFRIAITDPVKRIITGVFINQS